MTRLGSKLPFEQAAEEVWLNQQIQVEASTVRKVTHRYGKLAEAIARAEAERVEQEAPQKEDAPEKMLVSADGAFIHLTTGEWREVKTVAIGEVESVWQEKAGQVLVKAKNLSYFSRSYGIRAFERYALAETHRRGLAEAQQVVTVNDGSEWIQSFVDFHIPQAKRILDFRHAADYVAQAGKAALGEGTAEFGSWFARTIHQLKHKPPQQTISDICLLVKKVDSDEQLATIDTARRYLQKREAMIDYPYFQARDLPIGSGSVESSHKSVVHSRMKQAGMRWAIHHVDPMLALRNLICNGRWTSGWSHILSFYWEQQHEGYRERACCQNPQHTRITFDSVKVAPDPTPSHVTEFVAQSTQPYRPAPDHPWRQGIWPTQEAWRWN